MSGVKVNLAYWIKYKQLKADKNQCFRIKLELSQTFWTLHIIYIGKKYKNIRNSNKCNWIEAHQKLIVFRQNIQNK